jgi:hypothetical protein
VSDEWPIEHYFGEDERFGSSENGPNFVRVFGLDEGAFGVQKHAEEIVVKTDITILDFVEPSAREVEYYLLHIASGGFWVQWKVELNTIVGVVKHV